MRAYADGDPYLGFAIDAGLAPADATKASHGALRGRCKAMVLGTLYGMQEASLAAAMGVCTAEARAMLQAHRRTYATFWAWSQRLRDVAMLGGHIDTCFGWRLHVCGDTRPTSLMNHPMQAHGAEMLRLACCLLTEDGIDVCAPVHDAVLIQADANRINEAVARTRHHMARAARTVLDGFEIRTDADVIVHPQRLRDDRGEAMWNTVAELLAGLDGQPRPM
jgi:DNA polymerase-1